MSVRKRPCSDCPFRREGHIPLAPFDASQIATFVERSAQHAFACHASKRLDCAGAVLYRENVERPGTHKTIFDSEEEIVAANDGNKRESAGWATWGVT